MNLVSFLFVVANSRSFSQKQKNGVSVESRGDKKREREKKHTIFLFWDKTTSTEEKKKRYKPGCSLLIGSAQILKHKNMCVRAP